MEERKEERKAKWDQPEIEEFQSDQEREAGFGQKHGGCFPNHGGCRPGQGECRPGQGSCRPWQGGGCSPQHGGCGPNQGGCFPRMCAPRKGCFPFAGFIWGPYCRPFGFNFGYGCFPRR